MARPMPKPETEAGTLEAADAIRHVYVILLVGFVALPIIAGLDKFFHVLVDWPQYLAPVIPRISGLSASIIMMIVGVVEIVAGIIVAFTPKFGGFLVMAWLWGIIINLLLIPGYYDIALRDFGLSLGALALALLSNGLQR